MTKDVKTEEYWISDWYLSALINGDYSSFGYYYDGDAVDREIKRFDDWVHKARAGRPGHWTTPAKPETDEFGTCEVNGTRGTVEKVLFVLMPE